MAFSKMHPFIVETSANLFLAASRKDTEAWLMSLRQASPVSHSQPVASDSVNLTQGTNGLPQEKLSKLSDPDSCCSKTFLDSSAPNTLRKSSGKYPNSGIFRDGQCLELTMPEHRTGAKESGLWLTPINQEGRQAYQQRPEDKQGSQINLTTQVKNIHGLVALWNRFALENLLDSSERPRAGAIAAEICCALPITCTSQIAGAPPMKSIARIAMSGLSRLIQEFVNGVVAQIQINQEWIEMLMGLPIGWTDLRPLETDRFRQWSNSHGKR